VKKIAQIFGYKIENRRENEARCNCDFPDWNDPEWKKYFITLWVCTA